MHAHYVYLMPDVIVVCILFLELNYIMYTQTHTHPHKIINLFALIFVYNYRKLIEICIGQILIQFY